MKVYEVVGNGHYSAGMAIVVAEDEEHAKIVANGINRCIHWGVDLLNPKSITELNLLPASDDPVVVTYFEFGE